MWGGSFSQKGVTPPLPKPPGFHAIIPVEVKAKRSRPPPKNFKGPVFEPPQFRCKMVGNGRKMVKKRGPIFFHGLRPELKVLSWGGSWANFGIKGPVDPPWHSHIFSFEYRGRWKDLRELGTNCQKMTLLYSGVNPSSSRYFFPKHARKNVLQIFGFRMFSLQMTDLKT